MQADAGVTDFDYAEFADADAEAARAQLVHEKGFFILPSQLFGNVRKHAKDDPNLNITLDNAFKAIEASAIGTESEDDLKGLLRTSMSIPINWAAPWTSATSNWPRF